MSETHAELLERAAALPYEREKAPRRRISECLIRRNAIEGGLPRLIAKSASSDLMDTATFELLARWSRAIPKVLELLKKLDDLPLDPLNPPGERARAWLEADGTMDVAAEIQDLLDGRS